MLRASVSTLVMVLAVASCAAPVQQSRSRNERDEGRGGRDAASASRRRRRPWRPPARSGRRACRRRGNFEEVPLGKWADYEETYLDAATIKERVALVAREADVVTLETTTETRPGDRTVFATVFAGASSAGWRVTGNVFQVGDDEPDGIARDRTGAAAVPARRSQAS